MVVHPVESPSNKLFALPLPPGLPEAITGTAAPVASNKEISCNCRYSSGGAGPLIFVKRK